MTNAPHVAHGIVTRRSVADGLPVAASDTALAAHRGEHVRFLVWNLEVGVKVDWHTVQVFDTNETIFACPAQVREQYLRR